MPESKKIGALVKTSLVDFPGRVSTALFLKGCNLRCPYCYNSALVQGPSEDDFVTFEQVAFHLEKRKNVLSGFVISGGEALINPLLPDLIKFARNLGYKIKLDTNGTNPGQLFFILNDESTKPDFIAMDIKTSPNRYTELTPHDNSYTSEYFSDALIHSINLIQTLGPSNYEFRTVLVPALVQKEDIKSMAQIIPKEANWYFTQFKNGNCLDPLYNAMTPYSDYEAEELTKYAKSFVNGAQLR